MKDKRYTVSREYCGHAEARHVVRFCGRWVGQRSTKTGARTLIDDHARERDLVLTGRA